MARSWNVEVFQSPMFSVVRLIIPTMCMQLEVASCSHLGSERRRLSSHCSHLCLLCLKSSIPNASAVHTACPIKSTPKSQRLGLDPTEDKLLSNFFPNFAIIMMILVYVPYYTTL